jgi:hypothetical protein
MSIIRPKRSKRKTRKGDIAGAKFRAIVRTHLKNELGPGPDAPALAGLIVSRLLAWQTPTTQLKDIRALVAFSFGNRMLKNGNLIPGPINLELAHVAIRVFEQARCKVYAQWEIAESIGTGIPAKFLYTINPEVNGKDGTLNYLSTFGVIQQVQSMTEGRSGKFVVVAHRDHAWRCFSLMQKAGFPNTYAPPFGLPTQFDPLSAQPWTRNRYAYLLHELSSRLSAERAELLEKARHNQTRPTSR